MTDHTGRNEIYANAVRAGKRTYFFDVKETRKGEYFLTLTESKRKFNKDDGKFFYEKHKLFLYKEDFEKFTEALQDVIEFIKSKQEVVEKRHDADKTSTEGQASEDPAGQEKSESPGFSDISFDDLNSGHPEKE
ncbi:MAG: DUF3276 family protein [Bacteroidales bacterium]